MSCSHRPIWPPSSQKFDIILNLLKSKIWAAQASYKQEHLGHLEALFGKKCVIRTVINFLAENHAFGHDTHFFWMAHILRSVD
jgi:hypothetical protein